MNLYENLTRALALLNGLPRGGILLEEAIRRLSDAKLALEAEGSHVRATGLAVGTCHLHRASCAAEITLHLPGGKHATACLSHGNLSSLVDLLEDHGVPIVSARFTCSVEGCSLRPLHPHGRCHAHTYQKGATP